MLALFKKKTTWIGIIIGLIVTVVIFNIFDNPRVAFLALASVAIFVSAIETFYRRGRQSN